MITELPLFSNESQRVVKIEFDGGTPCNIPRLGYGIGYGSYRINEEQIVRVDHGIPMSNNVAEIATLLCALNVVAKRHDPGTIKLNIHGDSKIALSRCITPLKKKKSLDTEYGRICHKLISICGQFQNVSIHWRGRQASVKLFGH